jgi:hypothetical protein
MKKFIIAATAALTLVGTIASTTTEAQAKKWGGWGGKHLAIGLGVGMLGAAAASSYYYADDCRVVRVYDRFGNFRGHREICS